MKDVTIWTEALMIALSEHFSTGIPSSSEPERMIQLLHELPGSERPLLSSTLSPPPPRHSYTNTPLKGHDLHTLCALRETNGRGRQEIRTFYAQQIYAFFFFINSLVSIKELFRWVVLTNERLQEPFFFLLSHIGLSPLTVKNKQNTTFK